MRKLIMVLCAVILSASLGMTVLAQDQTGSGVITVNGAVESINLNIVTVGGQKIQFHPADPTLADLSVGDVIEVSGSTIVVEGVTVVIPSSVIIIIVNPGETPESTPESTVVVTPAPTLTPDPNATPEATPESTAVVGETITVTGVLMFVGGEIWVGEYKIAPSGAFNPSDYDEGDTVSVTGLLLPDGVTIQATSIVLVDDRDIVIIIEGPVEDIDLDLHIIVVYGFEFAIDPNSPIWIGLEIGDIVHLVGDWDWDLDWDGATIVIVVINIVIVEPPIIVVPGGGSRRDCWVNPGGNLVCPGRGMGRSS